MSEAVGKIQGSPPAATTIAASIGPFELRIWPGAGRDLTGTISSPVVRMATRGRAKTSRAAWPQAAASATCAARNRCSGAQQFISLARLRALGHDVFAHGNGALRRQLHLSVRGLYMLKHHHGIGARRNRSAGHDLPG